MHRYRSLANAMLSDIVKVAARWRKALWVMLWVFVGVGATALLVLVGWAVWRVPQALYAYVPEPKDRADVEASTRTGMVAGLAGLAALGSLALTTRTYHLTQQGQLTDRYTKAIVQLGDDQLDVRLGGIYALERIAVDSKRDHPTIVEVLSAYVRERSAPVQMVRPANRRTAHPPTLRKHVTLTVDVQAALTVLGRLPARAGVSRGNLAEANLANANLREANLANANLRQANLTGANLYRTNLSLAHLGGANLTTADLSQANLTDAYLGKADLTGASLFGVNLKEADLKEANLTRAELGGANLTRAELRGANLTETDLYAANFTRTRLDRTDLTSTKSLTQPQVDTAFGDESTLLPAELRRPKRWRSRPIPPAGWTLRRIA